jgi:haloacetate dehalogenase
MVSRPDRDDHANAKIASESLDAGRRNVLFGATAAAMAPWTAGSLAATSNPPKSDRGANAQVGDLTPKQNSGTPMEGFDYQRIATSGATINVATRGKGVPLLLLHGYPENHRMWEKVAPALAQEYAVVCADLRGYGDSSKPEGAPDHSNYSKRAMASDMVEVMAALGHRTFFLAGHDRGGRVAYRLALDHSGAVRRLALLDIVSTRAVYEDGGTEMARRYFHWYFLIQSRPLPERLIAGDPAFWLERFLPEGANLREYLRTFGTAEGIHATCEDYRAGFAVDLAHDRADVAVGRKIVCPTMILWGSRGVVGSVYKPLETWKDLAASPTGYAIECGHFIPEEKPDETIRALRKFFRS